MAEIIYLYLTFSMSLCDYYPRLWFFKQFHLLLLDSTIKVWDLRTIYKKSTRKPVPKQEFPYCGTSTRKMGRYSLPCQTERSVVHLQEGISITLTLLQGWWGRCEKNYLRKEEGRVEKKARAARPPDPGLEPRTCRVVGEGPQLHARGLFRQASLSVPIIRVGRLRNTMCCVFWR